MSENTQTTAEADLQKMYQYATILKINGKNIGEIKATLLERGLDETNANTVMEWVEQDVSNALKRGAKRDMLYGVLWCLGGLALTYAHIGLAIWAPILFGGIKLLKGFMNYSS